MKYVYKLQSNKKKSSLMLKFMGVKIHSDKDYNVDYSNVE